MYKEVELKMVITKNVFQMVADIVKHNTKGMPEVNANMCKAFAGEFTKSNPRFNEGKFMNACRVDKEKM